MKADPRGSLPTNSIMKRFYVSPLVILRMTFDENALLCLSFAKEFFATHPFNKLFFLRIQKVNDFPVHALHSQKRFKAGTIRL